MTLLFAITTRGLEDVSAAEVATLPQTRVTATGYRRVMATCTGPLGPVLGLHTVDDVFLDEGTWLGLGPERTTLEAMRTLAARLTLYRAAGICGTLRPVPAVPAFSVTANFVGARNYTTDEIKLACAAGIEAAHPGWAYAADDREADLNVRLFIEHETAQVGVRLCAAPLQNRPYKQHHVPGSLRPPVAAAMAWLAGIGRGHRVLDPCCGAGTLLIEATQRGGVALGGDTDVEALTAAQANVAKAGVRVACQRWDAAAMPIRSGSIDGVVTNPPWGRKVEIEVDLAAFYADLGAEIRRVLSSTGRAVILTWAPEWVKAWDLRWVQDREISLYGRRPTIVTLAR